MPIKLADASEKSCKYIEGEGRSMLICGEDVIPNSSYCWVHYCLCVAHPHGYSLRQNEISDAPAEGHQAQTVTTS
jgi:hypothetical protein